SANAGNCGRRKPECDGLGQPAELRVEMRLNRLKLLSALFPVAPLLHADVREGAIAGAAESQHAESRDAGHVFDARSGRSDLLDFREHFFGSLQGRRVRKLDVQKEVTLIFVRDEAGWKFAADPQSCCSEAQQNGEGDRTLSEDGR